MILQRFELIFFLFPIFIVLIAYLFFYFKKSNNFIREYFFFKTSVSSKISRFFLYLSFFTLFLALLDFRGEEEKIKANIPDQRTIILIDSSMSMLVEDVRPSRFLKGIQVARHFVKNSAANQFSIFIFSDSFQRILPFTDDLELVDARLSALESLATVKGSSNIGFTLKGMIPYLQSESDVNEPIGNILVISDGEEQEKEEKIDIPKTVSVAFVGVGTTRGGQIPLRWKDGSFKGFKNLNGSPITSRLNENYIKNLGKTIDDYSYWIVNSFNLPSNEIAEFFKEKFLKGGSVGEVKSRKAYGEYPIALFIIFYCLSIIFSRFKSFTHAFSVLITLCFIFSLTPRPLIANESAKEEKTISPETLKKLEKIKTGKATKNETLQVAKNLLQEGFPETSKKLYEENMKRDGNETPSVLNNYAASLVEGGDAKSGVELFNKLLKDESLTSEEKVAVRKNLLNAIKKNNDEKKKDSQENKNENADQDQSNKKENTGNDKQDGQNSDDSSSKNENNKKDSNSSNSKNQNQKGSKEEKDLRDLMKNSQKDQDKDKNNTNEQKNKEKKEDGKGDKNQDQSGKSEPKIESLEERENRIKQQRKMKKTPAILKQTMDQDRELQKKFLDASKEKNENEKADSKPSKDW